MYLFVPKEIARFNQKMENRFGITRKSLSIIFDSEEEENKFFEHIAAFVANNQEKPLKFFKKAAVIPYILNEIWFVISDPRDDNMTAQNFFAMNMYNRIGHYWKIISNGAERFFLMVMLKYTQRRKG